MPSTSVARSQPTTWAAATRRLTALVGMALAALALVAVTAGPVSAHEGEDILLVASTPAAGDTVAEPPARLVLEFDKELYPSAEIVLTDADGEQVPLTRPSVDGRTASAQIVGKMDRVGTYAVNYRVSDDEHSGEGRFFFDYDPGAAPQPTPAAASPGESAAAEPVATPTPAAASPAAAATLTDTGNDGDALTTATGRSPAPMSEPTEAAPRPAPVAAGEPLWTPQRIALATVVATAAIVLLSIERMTRPGH